VFALLAAIDFAVWAFGGHVGSLNLEAIGLALLSLELGVPWVTHFRGTRVP
jgi:hypothetical protein